MTSSASSSNLSDCFVHHLKLLKLNEFPCNDKSLSKKDKIELDYEKELLLDLIKYKNSPWYEIIDWSKNGDSIRRTRILKGDKFNYDELHKYFTSLKFIDNNITQIDSGLKHFINLDELVLTCNQITECDLYNLPPQLKILDLTGNFIENLSKMNVKFHVSLQHLSLGHNWLTDLNGCLNHAYWKNLVLLDVSFNQITNLVKLIDDLSKLEKLKILNLHGNPVSLLPGYRGYIIDKMTNLFSLDDKPISKEEKINFQDFQYHQENITNEAIIIVKFLSLKNLPIPEQSETENDTEINITKYQININLIDSQFKSDKSESLDILKSSKLHSMITYPNRLWRKNFSYRTKKEFSEEIEPNENVQFQEKDTLKFSYDASCLVELRDFLLDGTSIELIEKKLLYKTKESNDTAEIDSKLNKANKKEAKKEEPKKDAGKKDDKKGGNKKNIKNMSAVLENYNLVNCEERVLARFDLELSHLLDGLTREIKQSYSENISKNYFMKKSLIKSAGSEKKNNTKNNNSDNNSKVSATPVNKKKTEIIMANQETLEDNPNINIEFGLSFELFDFHNYNQLKNHKTNFLNS